MRPRSGACETSSALEAELEARQTAAMAAEDAARQAEDAVADKLELAERMRLDAERRDEEASSAFEAPARSATPSSRTLETLEVRRREILGELAQREVEAEAKVEDVMRRARAVERATDRAAAEQRGLIAAVEQVAARSSSRRRSSGGARTRLRRTAGRSTRFRTSWSTSGNSPGRRSRTCATPRRCEKEPSRISRARRASGPPRRIDAQKREHEAAVVRLEQLHREAAGLEREASERRAAYEAELKEFREELDAAKKGVGA